MALNAETLGPGGGSGLLSLMNVILVLAVIIVVIILLIRFLGRRNQIMQSGRSIRTLGAIGLGPNKSVQVLEVGGSLYLIGVGENVTMLDKITDPDEVMAVITAFEEESAGGGWGSMIQKLKSRLQGKETSQGTDLPDDSPFYEVLQSKLRSPGRKEKMEELLRDERKPDDPREL